jgi:hypothetical protein
VQLKLSGNPSFLSRRWVRGRFLLSPRLIRWVQKSPSR